MTMVSTTAARCSCNRIAAVGLTSYRSALSCCHTCISSSLRLICVMGFNFVVTHLYCMANL